MTTIPIDEVKETYEAQARAAICEKTVAEYADAMSKEVVFPPITVFADGIEYLIAEGNISTGKFPFDDANEFIILQTIKGNGAENFLWHTELTKQD